MTDSEFCMNTACAATWRHIRSYCDLGRPDCDHGGKEGPRKRKYDGGRLPLLCDLCSLIVGWWEPTAAKSLYIFHEWDSAQENGVHTYSHLGA